MIKVKIIIIIMSPSIVRLFRNVYVPALALMDLFTIFTSAYSVYTIF